MRIAIDAMGNDNGPTPIVQGIQMFLEQDHDSTVIMVGDRDRVSKVMIEQGIGLSKRLELVHASQVMEMEDKVADLREKRDSSIMRLVSELKEGRVDAMVALGNTAAAVGAATIGLKLITGVRRPGIAIAMPTRKQKPCVVVDMGANTACKPSHLVNYGIMASIYSAKVLGATRPRVGLLNVGEERSKGNEGLREAFELLEQAPINFIGNVEGGDCFSGECDVVVCDGFVGNAILKASETLASTMSEWMKEAIYATWYTKYIAGTLLKRNLTKVKKRLDYAAYGGAPLLGVNGVCLIGHGRSTAAAVASALRTARESVNTQVNKLIRENIERMRQSVRLKAVNPSLEEPPERDQRIQAG